MYSQIDTTFHRMYNIQLINEFYNPPMLSAKIFINGEDVPGFQDSDHKYYKYTVPLSNRLSRPFRNIYTYAFSMNPVNVEPSGSLDFSQLQSNRTVLDVKMVNGLTSDYTLTHVLCWLSNTFIRKWFHGTRLLNNCIL